MKVKFPTDLVPLSELDPEIKLTHRACIFQDGQVFLYTKADLEYMAEKQWHFGDLRERTLIVEMSWNLDPNVVHIDKLAKQYPDAIVDWPVVIFPTSKPMYKIGEINHGKWIYSE
jgi:hypothetical protein